MSLAARLLKCTLCIIRCGFILLNNLYCIPTYVIWMLMLQPLRFLNDSLYWKIEGIFFHWLLAMVSLWSYTAEYHIVESGDNVDEVVRSECLVLVNHQSTSDVPLLMAAFNTKPGLLPNLNWIMDGVFKFTNFGIVSFIHGDFFIASGRDKREATVRDLAEYLKQTYVPRNRKWLVLFPEGGFLWKRRETSHRFAEKNNLPKLNNVTLPRTGAVEAIIQTLAPSSPQRFDKSEGPIPNNNYEARDGELRYIIDLTIGYKNGEALDLGAILFGYAPPQTVRFHYRIFPISSVPRSSSELTEWMYGLYISKESLLDEYYKTGIWNGMKEEPARILEQDLLRGLILHFTFLSSTYLHYSLLAPYVCAMFSFVLNLFAF